MTSPRASVADPRQQIMRIEKRIFAENKRVINEATVVSDPGFKAYWRHYKKSVSKYRSVSGMDEVIDAVGKAKIVLVGDYHTLDQSQRSFVRLLRSYFEKTRDKKVTVALETVQARFQKRLQDFIVGRIPAEDFIRRIGFKKHWFFDLWSNYEVIFDFLIYHHIPLQAIDADNRKKLTLLERDAFMADELVKLAKTFPDEKIFVLVGDLHLAPRHLPAEIARRAEKENLELPILSLYQNSPEIYWRLSAKGLVDHVDVVRMGPREFCRMHTPPIIVQQSYMNWLYHEDDSFDWIDAKGSFLHLVERIAKIIGLKLPPDYEDVEVFTCGDLSFLKTLRKKRTFTRAELKFVEYQVLHSHSYFLPRARLAYIANVSVHHAAEEATHYLKFLHSGEEFPRSRQDAFYANALHEAAGFFGSKLINAKRKCARYHDFVEEIVFLKAAPPGPERDLRLKTAELFVRHADGARRNQLFHPNAVAPLTSDEFLSITHAIGYDLGEHLYYGFMSGAVPRRIVKALFSDNFEEEGEPGRLFLSLGRMLKGVKRPPKV